ncbi:hypothetical protein FHG87_015345 [Trinorchestia longiramus]|nr:hypothetical protein FHG87_015345 [Trinorchestia longiramus]
MKIGLRFRTSLVMLSCGYLWKSSTFIEVQGQKIWRAFSAAIPIDMTGLKVVENEKIVKCSMRASQSSTNNFFCSVFGRCIYGTVFLPSVVGEYTKGYKCYATIVCFRNGTMLTENEILPSPHCPSLDAVCTKAGLVPSGATVKHRRTCDLPFKQYSFGCMYILQHDKAKSSVLSSVLRKPGIFPGIF